MVDTYANDAASSDAAHTVISNSNYTVAAYRGDATTASAAAAAVSSTDAEYEAVLHAGGAQMLSVHSTHVASSSSAHNGNAVTGVGMHQRRGSLQLWQFLVALLDEPSAR